MRRVLVAIVGLLPVLAGCTDEDPGAPTSTAPSAAIVHGPSGGNPFFQWLPFRFDPPSDFSADLSPRVEICALGSDGSCPLILNGTFTRTAGHGSTIEVILDDPNTPSDDKKTPRYELIWRTEQFTLSEEQVYRVRVLIGARELGFLDLKAARNHGQALRYTRESESDNDAANDVIGFRIGDAFPLLWGIFKGALCSPTCTPQNIGTADVFEGTVPATGGTFYTPSGHAATRIPTPPGGQPVNLVIARLPNGPCLPTHMQTAGACYLFNTEPKLPPDLAGVLVATCLNQSQLDGHWALFKFNPDRPDLGVRQLEHADEELIDDCSGFALREERGAARYAKLGLRLLGRSLAAVFGPKPLSAALENRGFTHTASGMEDSPFSIFDWGKPVRIVKTGGDGQTGAINSTLSTLATVQVLTAHGTAAPVSGAPLEFTFSNPAGGSSSMTQLSDANGNASTQWTLGSAAGTYSLNVGLGKFSGTRQGVDYTLVESKNRDESDDSGPPVLETPKVTFTALANAGIGAAALPGSWVGTYSWNCSDPGDGSRSGTSPLVLSLGQVPGNPTITGEASYLGSSANILGNRWSNVTLNSIGSVLQGTVDPAGTTIQVDIQSPHSFAFNTFTGVLQGTSITGTTINGDTGSGCSAITGPAGTFTVVKNAAGPGIAIDAAADAGTGPDLIWSRIWIVAENEADVLRFRLEFTPGTMVPATRVDLLLDTDENPATGFPGLDSGHNDAALMGSDFLVRIGSSQFVGNQVTVSRGNVNGSFQLIETLPSAATYGTDFLEVRIPMSVFADDGLLKFKVLVYRQISASSFTGVNDYLTNLGVAPGKSYD